MKKCSYCGQEFPDELSACPTDGNLLIVDRPGPPPVPSGVKPPATSLAKASLILGILSIFCGGPLLGIPAVICGHKALNRKDKFPQLYAGDGIAVAGLATGYIGICMIGLMAIMAGLLLPALAKAKQRAVEINCMNNLKQIGLATRLWSGDNNGSLPQSLVLMSNELANPCILICPADPNRTYPPAGSSAIWNPENVSYEFPGAGMTNFDSSPQTVIVRCPIHGTEVWADGSVHLKRKSSR